MCWCNPELRTPVCNSSKCVPPQKELDAMPDFQKRVVIEKKELDEKRISLCKFTSSEKFLELPIEQQELLMEQFQYMTRYSRILRSRIEFFNEQ